MFQLKSVILSEGAQHRSRRTPKVLKLPQPLAAFFLEINGDGCPIHDGLIVMGGGHTSNTENPP